MSVVAGWQDFAPRSDTPATRAATLASYLETHGETLDPLELRRIEGHLASAVKALEQLDEERETYLLELPHTD